MLITVHRERRNCTPKSTVGKMFIDGHYFSETLEDALRHPKLKILKETAVPCCTVSVGISYSSRFQRDMVILYNQPNGYESIVEGHSWKGLRVHGGNTAENTEGCILVAENRLNNDTIQGTRERPFTLIVKEALDSGQTVKLTWILE